MRVNRLYTGKAASRSTAGFTLLELTIVVMILGIVSAIAAPSWLSFLNRQRLNTAQYQVYQALQEAKSNATKNKATWQVSFQDDTGVVQWAVHPAEPGKFIPQGVQWHNLDPHIEIYKDKNNKGKCETTFDQPTQKSCTPHEPWRVQFNYMGNTNGQLGQITLITNNSSKIKRCVYVSTLIGTLRTGTEHSKVNSSDKYCY